MQTTAATGAELIIELDIEQRDGRVVSTRSRLPDHQPHHARLIGLELAAAADYLHSSGPYPRQAYSQLLLAAGRAAGGNPVTLDEQERASIERQLAAEAADIHLYQLMLLWPRALGVDTHRTQYTEHHRRLRSNNSPEESFELGGELLDLLAREMLGGFYNNIRYPRSLSEFIDRADRGSVLGEVLRKLLDLGPSQPQQDKPTPILGELSAAAWLSALGSWPSAEALRAPLFFGEPAETGPLARHAASPLVHMLLKRGHRLSARLFAKVSELADCASRLRDPLSDEVAPLLDAAPACPGVGIARVNTASGVLLCWLRLAEDRIADCAFIPPAAWNFHPQGVFNNEACADTVETPAAASLRLSLLALALEPALLGEIRFIEPEKPDTAAKPEAVARPRAKRSRDQGTRRR